MKTQLGNLLKSFEPNFMGFNLEDKVHFGGGVDDGFPAEQ